MYNILQVNSGSLFSFSLGEFKALINIPHQQTADWKLKTLGGEGEWGIIPA